VPQDLCVIAESIKATYNATHLSNVGACRPEGPHVRFGTAFKAEFQLAHYRNDVAGCIRFCNLTTACKHVIVWLSAAGNLLCNALTEACSAVSTSAIAASFTKY
jgi:hypothetical protein